MRDDDEAARAAAALLDARADYRVLRRLVVEEGRTGVGDDDAQFIGVAVDCETTGLSADDVIIEMALRRFGYDADGVITRIGPSEVWTEDPGVPLEPEIARLTGLTDAEIAGTRIDADRARGLLETATVIIAHNASFDAAFFKRRLGLENSRWACSCNEIDWRMRGFDGRGLGYLLMQQGYFFGGHRADADVDALIALLMSGTEEGRPALGELLANATAPTVRVRARGANIELKDLLKARGYRWDAAEKSKVWFKDIRDADLMEEEAWLAREIYCSQAHPKAIGPNYEFIDWTTRYGV